MAKTLSDQSDIVSYGVVSSMVMANKIVSYKSVYIFTNKLCLLGIYVYSLV